MNCGLLYATYGKHVGANALCTKTGQICKLDMSEHMWNSTSTCTCTRTVAKIWILSQWWACGTLVHYVRKQEHCALSWLWIANLVWGQVHANRKWFIWWTEHTVAKMCFVFRIRNKWEGKDRSGSIRINVQLKLLSLFVAFDWDGELQSGKVPRRKRPVVWKKWKLFLFIFCWFVSLWMTFHIKSSIIYTWSYKRCIFSVANHWIWQWHVYFVLIHPIYGMRIHISSYQGGSA